MNSWVRTCAAAAAVIVVAGGSGFALYRLLNRAAPNLTVDTAAPTTATAPRSETTAAEKPPQRVIPDRVPPIRLAGLDGKLRALADFHDPVLVINFWATWCVPCRREIPLLRSLRQNRHAQGVEIVGIAVDFRESVQRFVKETPTNYPLLVGEEDGLAAAESFGMDLVLPFTVFADAQRRIVTVKVGELHADEAAIILDSVQQINANTLDLALAKPQLAAKMRELAIQRAKQSGT